MYVSSCAKISRRGFQQSATRNDTKFHRVWFSKSYSKFEVGISRDSAFELGIPKPAKFLYRMFLFGMIRTFQCPNGAVFELKSAGVQEFAFLYQGAKCLYLVVFGRVLIETIRIFQRVYFSKSVSKFEVGIFLDPVFES